MEHAENPLASGPLASATATRPWLPYAALCLLVVVLYAPAFFYGFVWDDYDYIVEATRIQGLSAAHWKAILTIPYSAQYAPLHQVLLTLLYHLGGGKPLVFHIAQVLLHAACACLLYRVLSRIESVGVAAIAAALFAVHPAGVETVAWASENKSTLAFLLFLWSFLFFLRLGDDPRRGAAIWCPALFTLSLLAKASTVVGPAVLLAYCLWKEQLNAARARLIALLFAISISLTLLTLHIQRSLHADSTPDRLIDATLLAPGAAYLSGVGKYYGGWTIHLLNIPGLLAHYLATSIWPARLSIWQMYLVETGWTPRAVLLWSGFVAAVGGLAWAAFSRKWRGVAFWGCWFLFFLAPVLQLFPNPTWLADRYLYIPAIALFVLFARVVMYAAERARDGAPRYAVLAVPALVILAAAWATARHLPVWRNEVTLWSGAMNTCAQSAYCHDMLSLALRRQAREASGETQQQLRAAAVQEALQAVNLRADHVKWVYLGDALLEAGDPRAVDAYLKTRQLAGSMPAVDWALLAKAHLRFGNVAEARRILDQLKAAESDDPTELLVLAFVAWRQGQPAEAREAIARVMAMNTLYPRGPERTLRFVSYYWGDAAEAAQMLREIQAP